MISSGNSLFEINFTPRLSLAPSVIVYTPRMKTSMITRHSTKRVKA